MKKMRIFELAKKLSIDSRELIKIAKDLAISVENTMSMLDAHEIERIERRVLRQQETPVEQPAAQDEQFEDKRVSSKVIRRRSKARTEEEAVEAKTPQPAAPPVPAEAEPVVAETLPVTPEPEIPVTKEVPAQAPAVEEKPVREEAPAAKPVEAAAPEVEKAPVEKVKEAPAAKPAVTGPKEQPALSEEEKKAKKKRRKPAEAKVEAKVVEPAKPGVKKAPRGRGKQVYTQSDLYGNGRPGYGKKGRKGKVKAPKIPVTKKKIRIEQRIIVNNLAHEMSIKVSELIKALMNLGVMATANQYINADEAILVAGELGYEVEEIRDDIKEDYLNMPVYDEADMLPRPPVVTVMGHVDHGKTSLLDCIRKQNVVSTESGGITQHIGAYQATCKDKLITFIDTPGHEAFTSMRARGAQVTDFVILVVAADDGVMDQTREAINHSKAAGIPIIVAVNKIDKPNANPQRVKEQLAELELVPEDWGGETIFVDVSALKNEGIEELLEMVLLQAEMLDIKSSSKGALRGVALESQLDKARGPMCTTLIQHGQIKLGDVVVVGQQMGKVRAMFDFKGNQLKTAGPGTPVELLGLGGMPSAGDVLFGVPNDKKAKEIVSYLENQARHEETVEKRGMTLEDLYSQVSLGEVKELNVIIKSDVHGTVEAIAGSIMGIDTGDEIRINIIHQAVGGITENDILLASTSNAIVIGFNVRPEPNARQAGKKFGVDIKLYSVIYDIIEDIKQALTGMLEPVYAEVILGRAEVRDTFKVPKIGVIAGCMVIDGVIQRGAKARLLRDNVVIHDGAVDSLRRFKDDAREVASGYECGIGLGSFNDIKNGDIIEAYMFEERERETTW